jgi:two-component system copper resistance phosphate regulon response regulator CusR
VLFLTAKDSVEDRVRGLDVGVDDYLLRPFAFPELQARVRASLRRGKPDIEGESSGWIRNARRAAVRRMGKTIYRPHRSRIHTGRVVSREMLARDI